MHPTSRTIHTQTALTLTAALLTAGSLAACTSGSTSEAADASSTTPTIAATATPSTAPTPTLSPELANLREKALSMPEPDKPEHINVDTDAGAIETAVYFVDLYRYAFLTGDSGTLKEISDPQCIFCNSTLESLDELAADGSWNEPWDQELTLLEYRGREGSNPHARVDITASFGAMTVRDSQGNVLATTAPIESETLAIALYFDGEHWVVREAEVTTS